MASRLRLIREGQTRLVGRHRILETYRSSLLLHRLQFLLPSLNTQMGNRGEWATAQVNRPRPGHPASERKAEQWTSYANAKLFH